MTAAEDSYDRRNPLGTDRAAQWMGEPWRPQLHYTAQKNMINDPNGLIHLDGEFHLFHQYNQHEVVHWGHAVSTDLIHWEHLPPALFPDAHGQVYSGTAIVDYANVSGLRSGEAPVVLAYFTHADHHTGRQSQGLAFSNDRCRTWTMYPSNPIVPNPGREHFRDPKVFWHSSSARWMMVVTGGDHVEFYRSDDLLSWTPAFTWGYEAGSHTGIWECPDVFELPVDGGPRTAWVISVSVDRGAPAGGSGMQYFVGDLSGTGFENHHAPERVMWQNWGADFYAGITWENMPANDPRRLMIAWADNWLYRFDVPTTPFNGQLTIPRELTLVETADGVRLRASPATELRALRNEAFVSDASSVESGKQPSVADLDTPYEVVVEFDTDASDAAEFGLEVLVGPDEVTRIGYSLHTGVAFVDRRNSGIAPHPLFPAQHEVPVAPIGGRIDLHIFVDRSCVEVFVNGTEQITDLVLPSPSSRGCRLFAVGGRGVVDSLTVYPLSPIWPQRDTPIARVISGEWAGTGNGIQGSSAHIGMAVPTWPSDGRHEYLVTLHGTRNDNPDTLLGEHAAGVVLGYDPVAGTGLIIELDHLHQRIAVGHIGDPTTVLSSAPATVMPNRVHRLFLSATDRLLTIGVDGGAAWRTDIEWPQHPTPVALLVRDAEATFAIAAQ